MILTTSLFALTIHTELNLQTLKMCILQAPEHSAKRTMASIGSVFSLNSPRYQFLDHFHMTGCICALRTTGKTLFHFGKVDTCKYPSMRRILSIILPSGRISCTRFLSHLFGILPLGGLFLR